MYVTANYFLSGSNTSTAAGSGGTVASAYYAPSLSLPTETDRVVKKVVNNPLKDATVKEILSYLSVLRDTAGDGTSLASAMQTVIDTMESMDEELRELRGLVGDEPGPD